MTQLWNRAARTIRWHRRGLAAIAAALSVLALVSALRPPDPPTTRVVRAAADLPAGHQISAQDVVTVDLVTASVPRGAVASADELIGENLVGAVPHGQVLTPDDIVSGDLNPGDGHVLVPLRLRDAGIADLLQVGQVIAIVAADAEGTPVVVAERARVAAVPKPPVSSGAFSSDQASGVLIVVAVPRSEGPNLAAWAASPSLSVMFP